MPEDRAADPGAQPPPNGWDSEREQPPDPDALARALHGLLEVVPSELRARLIEAVRALLEAIRALIEWWIDLLETRRGGADPPQARDVPIS